MRVGRLVSVIAAVILTVSVPGGGTAAGQDDFVQTGLVAHNNLRPRHDSPLMTLDQRLIDSARQCAQYYADLGRIDHSCPHKNEAGENLFIMMGGSPDAVGHVEQATQMWYDEIADYDYDNPGFSHRTGHFTQVVWKASTRLGIGYASKGDNHVVVALYDPPGNVEGKFPQNVARPR